MVSRGRRREGRNEEKAEGRRTGNGEEGRKGREGKDGIGQDRMGWGWMGWVGGILLVAVVGDWSDS